MPFTEDTFEQAVLEIFQNLGYTVLYGPELERDYTSPLLESVLRDSLVKLNRGLPNEAIQEAIHPLHPGMPKWEWMMTKDMKYALADQSMTVARALVEKN